MDVTCPRCGTGYRLDGTLVSPRGTHVRCTQCHHSFTVYPRDRSSVEPEWEIIRSNGASLTIRSFRELQRLIRHHEVTPQDMLRRPGRPAKQLAHIAELDTFFAAAGAGNKDQSGITELTAPFELSRSRRATPALYLADSDTRPSYVKATRSRWFGLWLWLGAFMALGGAGYLALRANGFERARQWLSEMLDQRDPGQLLELARDALDRAESPLLRATLEDLEESGQGTSPEALRIRSEGHAILAQYLRIESNPEAKPHAQNALTLAKRAKTMEEASPKGKSRTLTELAVANGLRLTGDRAQALVSLDSIVATRPMERAQWHFVRTLSKTFVDPADRLEELKRVVKTLPTWIPGLYVLAAHQCASGQVQSAEEHMRSIFRVVPGHVDTVALKQTCLPAPTGAGPTQKKEETTSEPHTNQVPASAQGQTRSYEHWVKNGNEQLSRGNLAAAETSFERALQSRPSGSAALHGLGYVSLERLQLGNAVSYFRRATEQGYSPSFIGLGQTYRHLGQTEKAITTYERYLKVLPNGAQASVARGQLRALRPAPGQTSDGDLNRQPPPPQDTLGLEE